MKRATGARALIVFTVLCAVSGFLLRTAFDNGGTVWELVLVSVISAAVILFTAIRLTKVTEFKTLFRSDLPDLILSLLGGGVILVSGILRMTEEEGFSAVLGALAIAAAVCLVLAALLRKRKKKPRAALYAGVVIFYVIKLFYDFRRWMVDPAVLDYCFMLFASISFMVATYHAALYCYDRGKRGVMVFFSLCGVYFGAVCVPDLELTELLLYIGSILWMLACGWQALRSIKEEKNDV